VHQVARYDAERGISYWTKNYHTAIEADDELAISREYPYYDPIYTLPESGQNWWRSQGTRPRASSATLLTIAGTGGQARQDAV
jgi:lysine 2,3-aminomutase